MSDSFLESLDEKLRLQFWEAQESLTITLSLAKELADSCDKEFQKAIEERSKGIPFSQELINRSNRSSVPAIDAWSSALPSGTEVGHFYSIDLGGSNLRAVAVRLEGRGETSITERKTNLRVPLEGKPKGLLDKLCTASELFDAVADAVTGLIQEVGGNLNAEHKVAFTFSFPIYQKGLASGELIRWTKEFETGCATTDPVVGQDVGQLMNQAFVRRGLPHAKVVCLINDTVGTILSAGYSVNHNQESARVGVILGTGFNIAYMDKLAPELNYQGSIINLECGNFNKVRPIRTLIDEELDYYSSNRGQQWAEKMISGLYLGELCRLWLVRVFQFRCPAAVYVRNSLEAAQAATIYNDRSKRYSGTQQVLRDVFGWELSDPLELRLVYKVVSLVFDRSAAVAGIIAYVCAMRTRFVQRALGGTTVGVDGSLYIENPKYQKNFQKTMHKLLGGRADLVNFVVAQDGSGKGAAIMAACEG